MRYGALIAVFLAVGCSKADGQPVRVTLADGQTMSGEVQTETLRLVGALGTLDIPFADVGEVVPVQSGALGASNGYVTVWLRNGTELVGRWENPELAVGIEAGGEVVAANLPMDRLMRFQTRAGELWPAGEAYRVRTVSGDDLIVDASQSKVVLENELGTFSPYLAECRSVHTTGISGQWKVDLLNGTTLIGTVAENQILFAMPLGPDHVAVPLEQLTWMERVSFGTPVGLLDEVPSPPRVQQSPNWFGSVPAVGGDDRNAIPEMAAPTPTVTRPMEQRADWFDSSGLRAAKERQVQTN